ncbi:MAG: type IV pilus biogenesis/stability protein PilW [Leptothrix sp. (in: b-proteobacteria)]
MKLFQCRWTWSALLLVCLLGGCVSQTVAVPPGEAGNDLPVYTPSRSDAPSSDVVTQSDEGDQAKRSRLRLELASAYFAQGLTSTALDEVKRALAADPNSAQAYNLRGLIYASMSEYPLADESFRYALQLSPADADTRHNYGWYLCGRRRFAEAAAQFVSALAVPQYRGQSKTWLARGICEARAGDLVASEKSLLHSYELDASNPATAFNLAEVLLRTGNLERAGFYIQRVNGVPDYTNAESLWLAIRIARRRGDSAAVDDLGNQLRTRFPTSRQASAYEQRQFDE